MEKHPLFSIILPFHNGEKTLSAAVCSVLEQTFSDYELLLVDDASEDQGLLLAERLAGEDERLRVISLDSNVGAARARDAGVRAAAGEFLMFLDADDAYEKDLLAQVAASLVRHPADAVVWGLQEDTLDGEERLVDQKVITVPAAELDTREQVRQVVLTLEEKSLYGYFWNKAYRTSVWRALNTSIPVQPFNEDIQFNLIFFQDLSSLNLLPTAPIHYHLRAGNSLTHRFLPDYYPVAMGRVSGLLTQQQSWGQDTPEVRRIIGGIWLRYLASALERNTDRRMGLRHRDRKQFLEQVYGSELYRELLPWVCPGGRGMRLLSFCLKRRWSGPCLLAGRGLHWVKANLPGLFRRVKG